MHTAAEAAAQTVVTITKAGTYRISGTLSAGQLAVDLGDSASTDPTAVVTLIFDGASITCKIAPAVIFYNVYECNNGWSTDTATSTVDTSAAGANVVIADGSTNNITGSHVAKIYKTSTTPKIKYDGAFYSCMLDQAAHRLLQHADPQIGNAGVGDDDTLGGALQRRDIGLNGRDGGELALFDHTAQGVAAPAPRGIAQVGPVRRRQAHFLRPGQRRGHAGAVKRDARGQDLLRAGDQRRPRGVVRLRVRRRARALFFPMDGDPARVGAEKAGDLRVAAGKRSAHQHLPRRRDLGGQRAPRRADQAIARVLRPEQSAFARERHTVIARQIKRRFAAQQALLVLPGQLLDAVFQPRSGGAVGRRKKALEPHGGVRRRIFGAMKMKNSVASSDRYQPLRTMPSTRQTISSTKPNRLIF